jgi:CBS domain-containing protein
MTLMGRREKTKSKVEEEAVKLAGSSLPIFEKYHALNLLHDQLCCEAVQQAERWMVEEGWGTPPVPYCWFELGSGGRGERTVGNDQDHGLIYGDMDVTQSDLTYVDMHREYFMLFSRRISYELEQAGYSLCTGNVMASNKRWRHEVTEWKQTILSWIEEQGMDEIRYLLILADMRAVYGDRMLCHRLKAWMHRKLSENKKLQLRFAEHSLVHEIPLGIFRNLRYERWGAHAGEYDVKEGGYYQLVNTIRILALVHNIEAMETRERLSALYRSGVLSVTNYERWLDALACMLHVRLTHHVKLHIEGKDQHNYVDVKSWDHKQIKQWKNVLIFLKREQKRLLQMF